METNTTPQERLQFFIKSHFNGSIKEFAKAMSMHPQTIYSYLPPNKSTMVSEKTLRKLRSLGINIDWYHLGIGNMLVTDMLKPTTLPDDIYLNLIDSKMLVNENINIQEVVRLKVKVNSKYDESRHIAFKLYGDSMIPTIPNDSLIIIDTERDVKDGNVIVAIVGEQMVCKRYYKENDKIILRSDNNKYADIIINDKFKLIGVAFEQFSEL